MRRLVAGVLAALPFDPRSRRALDETLLDWAHEEAGATHGFARARVGLRALLSVVRSVAAITMWEVVRAPDLWLVARAVAFVTVPSLVLTLGRDGLSGLIVRSGQPHWLEHDALLWPQIAILVAPIALFASVALTPRTRRVPAVGWSALTLVGMLACGGWLVPWANQRLRVETYAARTGADVRTASTRQHRGVSDWSPVELLAAQFVARPDDQGAAIQLTLKSGLGALGLLLVLLGAAVRELSRGRRAASIALVVLAYAISFGSLPLVEAFVSHAHPFVSVAPWCLTGFATFMLVRLGEGPERRLA